MELDPHPIKPISEEPMTEWHALHPEFNDEEWTEAMKELKEYLKIAWEVYRTQHQDLDLPDEL
jgi:hypothetical protein